MIVLSFIILIVFTCIFYKVIECKGRYKIKEKMRTSKMYVSLDQYIVLLLKKNIISNKFSFVTPFLILIIVLCLFFISYVLFYSYIKIPSTAIILSIPILLLPYVIINVLLNIEKTKIIRLLPLYTVNLKSHISDEKNILKAINLTSVEEPLKKYIEVFKSNVSKGLNVIEAFKILKKDVNVREFSELINACETCYLNGGNFEAVLDNYIELITKENNHKEEAKEKAYGDILTLIIMLILNILVVVTFVFSNEEYAIIIRNTFLGRAILNFNAVSYMFIGYLVSKIYKEE